MAPNNTAVRKDVQVGRIASGLRVIESGLAEGDKVIVEGTQKIFFPGAPVTPHDVAMDAALPGMPTTMN